ncbi:MAG: hypothetical protein ACKV0T_17205 [Planctomycetales bacterium]
MKLWVCGMATSDRAGPGWDLVGVFTERQLAVAACEDETYFIFPIQANVQAPHESVAPEGLERPLAKRPAATNVLPRRPR